MHCNILKFTKNVINLSRLKSNWVKPEGYDTSIKIYNCVAREKVPFIVRNKHYVTWYTCGPTVYDSAHIGHASCYVKLDIVQHILRTHFNLNIVSVMNITDIDDKIINRSKMLGVSESELAKKYEAEFWEDLNDLGVNKPDIILRVTENIPRIKDFIKKLLDGNKAYISNEDNSVYFSLKNYNLYGKLQNISETTSESENTSDFALWKSVKSGEPFWDANWGPGRPGWHIECSAMAGAIFGDKIDIHAGGIDLKFPHHENEEAQSCAHYNTNQWVNYWIHTGHLHLSNDQKMSKSLKNTISIQEMNRNVSSDVFRMACAMSHYRTHMEYNLEVLSTAESHVKKVKSFFNDCEAYVSGYIQKGSVNESELLLKISEANRHIFEALKDDFNTAKVIKTIVELISVTNKMLNDPSNNLNVNNKGIIILTSNFIRQQLQMFGFDFNQKKIKTCEGSDDTLLDILNDFRQNVRNYSIEKKDKDMLKLCDNVRDALKDKNINIQDFGKVSSWNRS